MRTTKWITALGLGGVLLAGAAWAESTNENRPERPPAAVGITGGVAGYTSGLGNRSAWGPTFGAAVSTRTPVSNKMTPKVGLNAELAYEGAEFAVTSGPHGEPGDGRIWRHNVGGMLKGGVDIRALNPYVGLGLGETYINVTDAAERSGLRNDWMTEIPVAAGVDFNIGQDLTAGIRGTYRMLLFGEFAEPTPSDNNPSGGLMGANATVGGRF